MGSKNRNIAVLSALVVLALAVTASAASATMLYEWKVNGTALKSGTSKELDLKTGALEFVVEENDLTWKFTSSKVKFAKGAVIKGGKPGAMEGALEFEDLAFTKPKTGCEVKGGKITTSEMRAEAVESAEARESGDVGTGKTEMLVTPVNSKERFWTTFGITHQPEKACAAEVYEMGLSEGFLAEVAPSKVEAKAGSFTLGKGSAIAEALYRNSKGEFLRAPNILMTDFYGGFVKIIGSVESELVSDERFGAF
jgi:hypothetical protein